MNFLAVAMNGTYRCGSLDFDIPGTFPYIIHMVVLLIKIIIPIILIIFGMLDLGKAVVASKEEEIKKGQQTFFKRLLAAAIVFFVVQIVQIVISFVSSTNSNDSDTIMKCFNCFINGSDNIETGCRDISR